MRSLGFTITGAEWARLGLQRLFGAPRVGMRFESDLVDSVRSAYEVLDVLDAGDLVVKRCALGPAKTSASYAPLALTDRELSTFIARRPHERVRLSEREYALLSDAEIVALNRMPGRRAS